MSCPRMPVTRGSQPQSAPQLPSVVAGHAKIQSSATNSARGPSMGVIESEEAAKRLARVIVSDIEIYNREKFQSGADLTNAIEEGRALFRSRVAPELLPLFTTVLEDRRGASRK